MNADIFTDAEVLAIFNKAMNELSLEEKLDANHKRFLNGCKGGAPVGNRNNPNGRKGGTNQEPTEKQPNVNVNNQEPTEKQPNVNVNENENVNREAKKRNKMRKAKADFCNLNSQEVIFMEA